MKKKKYKLKKSWKEEEKTVEDYQPAVEPPHCCNDLWEAAGYAFYVNKLNIWAMPMVSYGLESGEIWKPDWLKRLKNNPIISEVQVKFCPFCGKELVRPEKTNLDCLEEDEDKL